MLAIIFHSGNSSGTLFLFFLFKQIISDKNGYSELSCNKKQDVLIDKISPNDDLLVIYQKRY